MNFRTRILITSVLLVWIPLLVLAWLTRKETVRVLTEDHEQRVANLAGVLEEDLGAFDQSVRNRLTDLKAEIKNDNRFRLAAVEGLPEEKPYLLDYAGSAMKLLGLSLLRIQDASGQIVSSGHFRNEFNRLDPTVPGLLAESSDRAVLLRTRAADGQILVLAYLDSVRLGDRVFSILGGVEVKREFLARVAPSTDIAVSLVYPGGALSNQEGLEQVLKKGIQTEGWRWEHAFPRGEYIHQDFTVPFAVTGENARLVSATFIASYPLHHLARVIQNLDLWLSGVLFASILGTLLLSYWAAAGISRPLVRLAEKAGKLDLDHLDTRFRTRRRDEVGDLSRLLDTMVRRLRESALKIRAVERKATLGDVARQVNHDIRNGLTPIRNIVTHLTEVHRENPGALPEVWKDRGEALVSSVDYLDELANHYARFYERNPRRPCDVNEIVEEIATGREGIAGIRIRLELEADLPRVRIDPVALRRIIDNLMTNAQESMDGKGGDIRVSTGWERDRDKVVLTVADNGKGIPADEMEAIFSPFHSTKDSGTGLGLAIVRRMLTDCRGSIRVESKPGIGSVFTVSFPADESPARGNGGPV